MARALLMAFVAVLASSTARAAPAGQAPGIGWRYDGTGHYPGADPPLRWSPNENVRWKIPLPATGNASPVVIGDRVCVTSEPTTLLCFDAGDGHLLWSRANDYADTVPPEQEAAARAELLEAEKVGERLLEKQKELSALKRKARRQGDASVARASLEALDAEVNQLRVRLDRTARYRTPPTQDIAGYASPTPASDGQSIFALFGNGVVAGYDLAGKRRFIRWLGEPAPKMLGYDFGTSASPRLVGSTLIVGYGTLLALDATSGKERWHGEPFRDFGTPAIATSSDGDAIVATASGDLFNLDGRRMGRSPTGLLYVGPIADGDRVYFMGAIEDLEMRRAGHGVATAVRVSGRAEPRSVWSGGVPPERYYSTPLLHDGYLYAADWKGQLAVIDAATGRTVGQLRLGDSKFFASLAEAGGLIFAGAEDGTTFVVRPGKHPSVVERSTLEPYRATPFFAGRRVYVRTLENLWCFEKR